MPTATMRSSGAFFLACFYFFSPAIAFAPKRRLPSESSWTPARQTSIPTAKDASEGWTPRPTDAPRLDYGGIDLLKRDGLSMGTDTCGFVSGYKSLAVTCVKENAYCTNDGRGAMDCCTGDYNSCTSTMLTSCVDYASSAAGACAGAGPQTLCCWEAAPSCFTMLYSATAAGGLAGGLFSVLECATSGGVATLMATPPAATQTAQTTVQGGGGSAPTTMSTATSAAGLARPSSTSSTSSTSSPNDQPTGHSSSSNSTSSGFGTDHTTTETGVIAGSVVGGVAVVGLFAIAASWLILRHKRASSSSTSSAAGSSSSSLFTSRPSSVDKPLLTTNTWTPRHSPSPSFAQNLDMRQEMGQASEIYSPDDLYRLVSPPGSAYFPHTPSTPGIPSFNLVSPGSPGGFATLGTTPTLRRATLVGAPLHEGSGLVNANSCMEPVELGTDLAPGSVERRAELGG